MSALDDAIARLQYHVKSVQSAKIRLAPDQPVESATMLPLSIAYFATGEATQDTADQTRLILKVNVDVHFPRADLKGSYQKINSFAIEYMRRLGGDPTLNGSIDTIDFPISFQVLPTTWNNIETIMLQFSVPFKELTTPIT